MLKFLKQHKLPIEEDKIKMTGRTNGQNVIDAFEAQAPYNTDKMT